ncbi:MAG: Pyruvate, phosphate dikinase [Planctomycetes bacterium ADurb.Bin126]|nr:MAG: Pyruvate, phosphate dikinase [Planctomycetes bacterium ADurb.Bin126]HOD82820.1 pyruvate, phosphate dikinase [Phycisphaerae bacterium]HQL74633.1 pyruvate, phosphate dikinase [Phycisphaerae bacterium]
MAKKSGTKYVYFFGGGKAEGMTCAKTEKERKLILGGKGSGLADMTAAGLPVPPGFTITCQACDEFYKGGRKWPKGLAEQVEQNIKKVENVLGKTFGQGKNPLLFSVRSGAAVSMPGMMDTVLNLGLNDETLQSVIDLTGNERFAYDAYRRFMQMFGDVVLGIEHHDFEHALQAVKDRRGAKLDTDLDVEGLKEVVAEYKKVYEHAGKAFPQDAREQLADAVNAVFQSWNNPRANKYRQLNDIRGLIGTGVNVQTMVFGNMGNDSGTGVAFTRDPSTGENKFYGEFLMNAQGEDVVAGIRTPEPIEQLARHDPAAYTQLVAIRGRLEKHYKDMQDIEFTIEKGKLYMLQTRSGKRTIFAAVRAAVEMAESRLITKDEAVRRVSAAQMSQLFAPVLDRKELVQAEKEGRLMASGLPASPGGACGQVVFNADVAEQWAKEGKKVILVRIETSPEDVGGMASSQAVVTARGGMTSHAAVVARGMGTPCVAGAGDLRISYVNKTVAVGDKVLREGDYMSISGFAGTIYMGQIKVMPSEIIQVQDGVLKADDSLLYQQYTKLMKWADSFRRLGVRTNADVPRDSDRAVKMGAEGIGLCRTEHMFFEGDRIVSFRRFILVAEEVKRLREEIEAAGDDEHKIAALRQKLMVPEAQYNRALAELLPLQRGDFEGIFRVMGPRPVTIRLLDPPLHEFLPQEEANQEEMAKTMGIDVGVIKQTVASLHEFNPMLGLRGCRLGISYTELTAMQVRAIIEAALNVSKEGVKPQPEIMIPLVGAARELELQRGLAEQVIAQVMAEKSLKKLPFPVKIGTMIEVPRGAITADEIARSAEFFSFGTNDLTQMGCGFSRDDAGKFLGDYVKKGIYDYDPFQTLDRSGVGQLVQIAVAKGRSVRPDIKLGICGEHGGDPMSVEFCHMVGLNYVSCSPYRVPVARLAAAQAALKYPATKPAAKKAPAKKAKTAKAAPKKAVAKKAPAKKAKKGKK